MWDLGFTPESYVCSEDGFCTLLSILIDHGVWNSSLRRLVARKLGGVWVYYIIDFDQDIESARIVKDSAGILSFGDIVNLIDRENWNYSMYGGLVLGLVNFELDNYGFASEELLGMEIVSGFYPQLSDFYHDAILELLSHKRNCVK